jgi:8-amino-7-oxononanoate synthase
MQQLLERRKKQNTFRTLQENDLDIDFCSNDYLSMARNESLKKHIHQASASLNIGATGSRLLTGHSALHHQLEQKAAQFHEAETALLFNSGYAANLSILSAVPRKSDVILYDALIHASLHDGLKLSVASTQVFEHNNILQLEQLLQQHNGHNIFVVVESIYSMDGDEAPLEDIVRLCARYQAMLIVDEAHSTGIYGHKGSGLCVAKGIEKEVFARIYTFGKAFGLHAAVIVGSTLLKEYLINFARPLIYTTALDPHSVLSIRMVYEHLEQHGNQYIQELNERIHYFLANSYALKDNMIASKSPIQGLIIKGNNAVTKACHQIRQSGFDVRAIRSPTVPIGQERIRICLHRHNSLEQIKALLDCLHQL